MLDDSLVLLRDRSDSLDFLLLEFFSLGALALDCFAVFVLAPLPLELLTLDCVVTVVSTIGEVVGDQEGLAVGCQDCFALVTTLPLLEELLALDSFVLLAPLPLVCFLEELCVLDALLE